MKIDFVPHNNTTIGSQLAELFFIIEDAGVIAGNYAAYYALQNILLDPYDPTSRVSWEPSDIDVFTFTEAGYNEIYTHMNAAGYVFEIETGNATTFTSPK